MTQVKPEVRLIDKLTPDEIPIDIEDKMTRTSDSSDAAAMMSNHTMRLVCYEINLGTVRGQRIHALHLILLPLLPILILLVQNYTTFDYNKVNQK